MNSRNHLKTQKFVIFIRENFQINMLKMKNIAKLEIVVIIQENIEVFHIAYVS